MALWYSVRLPLYEAAQKVEVPEGLRCQHGQRTVDAVRNAYHTNVRVNAVVEACCR